jgi:hypothetical protein
MCGAGCVGRAGRELSSPGAMEDAADSPFKTFLERAAEPLVLKDSLSRAVPPGPTRRCRDVPWLVVFLLYWVGMLTIAGLAFREGDPHRLLQGMDDGDQLCGAPATPGTSHEDLTSRPYAYFACLQYGKRRPTVCVSACPALSGHYVRWCAAASDSGDYWTVPCHAPLHPPPRRYNGTIITCDAHGRTIPATTYPTTHLQSSCVPSTATLYILVAGIIDVNAFTSVITGMFMAWRLLLLGIVAASLLSLLWMVSGPLHARTPRRRRPAASPPPSSCV